jgi:hypothetical protein
MPKYRLTLTKIADPELAKTLTATEAIAMDRGHIKPCVDLVFEQHFDDIDEKALSRYLNQPTRRRKNKTAN